MGAPLGAPPLGAPLGAPPPGAPLGAPNKSENLNSTFVQTDTMKSEEKSIQTDLTMKVVAVFIKGYYDLRQLAGAPGAPAETLKALK